MKSCVWQVNTRTETSSYDGTNRVARLFYRVTCLGCCRNTGTGQVHQSFIMQGTGRIVNRQALLQFLDVNSSYFSQWNFIALL